MQDYAVVHVCKLPGPLYASAGSFVRICRVLCTYYRDLCALQSGTPHVSTSHSKRVKLKRAKFCLFPGLSSPGRCKGARGGSAGGGRATWPAQRAGGRGPRAYDSCNIPSGLQLPSEAIQPH